MIEGGTLIDGRGGSPLPDAVLVIEDDRIAAIGKKGSVSYPDGAQILDADGKFVLPGSSMPTSTTTRGRAGSTWPTG